LPPPVNPYPRPMNFGPGAWQAVGGGPGGRLLGWAHHRAGRLGL